MAINGIGSYGGYQNYYQSVSQVRLQQALQKNPRYQQSIQAVEGVTSVNHTFENDSMDFLKSYSSTMADVMDSANALRDANRRGVQNDLTAVSSDTDIAEVAVRYPSRNSTEMALEVESLAGAQVNASQQVKGTTSAAGDMAFTVTGASGNVDVHVAAVKEDGTTMTNKEMLKAAADQINAGKTGVTASVTSKDGSVMLTLTADKTGTDSSFTVQGSLGAAAGADAVSTAAQNASYSVTDESGTRSYTSQSNDVTLDMGRISAKLTGTGKATVGLQADTEKVMKAVSDLVDSYNQATTFLSGNTSHGQGVSTQLSRLENSLAHPDTLERLGITKDKDGTLSLDKTKLAASLKKEPSLTKDLISGSSGLAQTMFNRASSAMRTSSTSLLSYDLNQIDQQAATDPIQYMSMYSKGGSYQMNNFAALGMMMNFLV